jgi:hypothetical protein
MSGSSKHEPAECPRCGTLFECKANSLTKCDCMLIRLTRVEIEYIASVMGQRDECLCPQCLKDIVASMHGS